MKTNLSIYVHIPFCDSKCYYCSFCSSVQKDDVKEKYFISLEKEIESFDSSEYVVKSIYFGGGTPSSVAPEFIGSAIEEIYKKFNVAEDAEITIECNPNSTNEEKLKEYKKFGVNRLSFGIQSFNKKSLDFVGRIQNNNEKLRDYKKHSLNVLKIAKSLGFNNISCDFILGLPFQKKCQLKSFFKQISEYVTHFSCYMLMLEEGTKLFDIFEQQGMKVDEDVLAEQYEFSVETLQKLGFLRYEISNFAKDGFKSRHNEVYWTGGEYVGFGLSAHSFLKGERIANTDNLNEYIKDFGNEKEVEKVSEIEASEEMIMLSLRTTDGLNLGEFKNKFFDLQKKKASKIAFLKENGFIEINDDFLRLTDKGFLLANKIILELVD